ncbi:MAG: M28 family peptidase [Bacteriovorax sp.]|nr:M28 family peptidase [Bacteriovorax sp.]
MKTTITQKNKTKNYIFNSFLILSSLTVTTAHSFEIKDYEKKIKTNYNITSATEKISRDALEKNLRDFVASGRPTRFVGSPGHQKALDYLEEKLKSFKSKGASYKKIEFTPNIARAGQFYADDFKKEVVAKISPTDPNYDHWKGFTLSMMKTLDSVKDKKGYNLIWEKIGTTKPSEVIILGANYDTLLNDPKTMMVDTVSAMPGADNNGTGVAALLSMIEILDKLDLPKTVRIVFFDFEELGFSGSHDYVEKLTAIPGSQKITGYINLVMLGNDSKREDKEKKLNNMKVYLRAPGEKGAEDDLKLTTLITNNGKSLYKQIDFKPEANGMNSSSHISFWEAGIPAICMSQNWESDFNPRFHTPNDFVETLNMNTYINAFRYITGAVLAWNYDVVKLP